MKSFIAILLLASDLVVAGELRMFAPVSTNHKRELMSCDETYGAGSVQCGDASAGMCYKPTQGEVCSPAPAGPHRLRRSGGRRANHPTLCRLAARRTAATAGRARSALPLSDTAAPR